MSEKTKGEQLREELLMNPKNLTETMSEEELKAAYDFCEGYKTFLDNAKTEREAVRTSEKLLLDAGYKKFVPGEKLAPGTKVYTINREKCVLAATIGTKSLEQGFHLNIAHIDSPRLDLKQTPMYEDSELAYFLSLIHI